MDKNQIKIISVINDFKAITRVWFYGIKGKCGYPLNIESEEYKSHRFDELLAFYVGEYVEQCIYRRCSDDTKIFELNQRNFTQDFFNEMNLFGLITKTHRFGHKYLSPKENDLYRNN